MKTLKLAPEVTLPIDALMQPIALLGNRGGGKTYCGQSVFELAFDVGVQCIALDVVGKWFALRLGAKGTAAGGLAGVYVFGGKHADFPITPDRGDFVAKVIVENHIHAVIDLSLMRKGDRRRFLTDFAEGLFLLKKQEDAPQPCVLFLEEAHAVLPQKPQADEARMLGAFEDIVREGRNHGIGVVIMDQRPATVNKNALALIEILIALRTTYKIDRDVYEDWIVQKGAATDVKLGDVLPFLKAGQGYLYAPIYDLFQRVTINPKRTYDASQTAKIGQAQRVIGQLTPVDVDKVREAMAEVVASVDRMNPGKLLDRALKAEHALSTLQLSRAKTVEAKPPKRVEVQVVKDSLISKLDDIMGAAHGIVSALNHAILEGRKLNAIANATGPAVLTVGFANKPANSTQNILNQPARPAMIRVRSIDPTPLHPTDFKPVSGELKMLAVLAQRAPTALTRAQLRTLAGFTDGTFRTYGPRLHRNGLIEINGDSYSITSEGAALVGDVGAVQTPDQVLDMWKRNLVSGERELLDLFKSRYPDTITREIIAAECGFTAGTLRTYLPRLARLGLITEVGGLFALSGDLFGP